MTFDTATSTSAASCGRTANTIQFNKIQLNSLNSHECPLGHNVRVAINQGATQMKNLVLRFLKNDSGATAIEYGLIAAGISVAIIAVVNCLGSQLYTTFSKVTSDLAAQ